MSDILQHLTPDEIELWAQGLLGADRTMHLPGCSLCLAEAAWPYGSSAAGSPPIQCVSTRTPALRRAQLAVSASVSQSSDVSRPGDTYISCSCVPVPKYAWISAAKSRCGSVSRLCACRA